MQYSTEKSWNFAPDAGLGHLSHIASKFEYLLLFVRTFIFISATPCWYRSPPALAYPPRDAAVANHWQLKPHEARQRKPWRPDAATPQVQSAACFGIWMRHRLTMQICTHSLCKASVRRLAAAGCATFENYCWSKNQNRTLARYENCRLKMELSANKSAAE